MDITPIYELRNRLRGAAIAGTGLISEDFRLKKAAEAFSALSGASPVFAKLNELVKKLLSDNSNGSVNLPETLVDALTLADAVIVTLGTSGVKGDFEPIAGSKGAVTVNAPYSRLAPLINALTVSGSGSYSVFTDTLNNSPELMNDYRVKSILVKGLGASYPALAAEVAGFLPKMGEDIIPLLKNSFDNKGKKEMAYRVEVMEAVAGARENDFYLSQLETAENDARKALITALRFDKNNFEKLTALVKTEKGEAKKSALRAIMYMDDEKAAEYFREYSKKKPAEVLELLSNVSTKMTSDLAAEVINRSLADKDGNRISLSQAVTTEAIKSNVNLKVSWANLHGAMCGKFGTEIEALYRDFYTDEENYAAAMDRCLGNSILTSGDEGLKKLALELNNKSKMKGRYVYSEATVRLLSGEDSTKWFDSHIKALPPNAQVNVNILEAIGNLVLNSEEYALSISCKDAVNKWTRLTVPVKTSAAESIVELMIKYYDKQPNYFGSRIQGIIDSKNRKMCKTVGEFFLKKADKPYKQNSIDRFTTMYLLILDRCGYKNIEGLAVRFAKNNPHIENWRLTNYISCLPGDKAYKLSETREIVKLAKAKKLKFEKLNIDIFEQWSEKEFM